MSSSQIKQQDEFGMLTNAKTNVANQAAQRNELQVQKEMQEKYKNEISSSLEFLSHAFKDKR